MLCTEYGSKRVGFGMSSWMLLSSLYLFVVIMLRSQRDSLTLAVIFNVSAGCECEVNRHFFQAWGVMDSLDHGVWHGRSLYRRTKVRVFRYLVLPVLLHGCETWTLTMDLRRRLNSFGTRSLRRIFGYRWSDFVSNERLLRETQMRFVTCIVREHQLRLYGHVARFVAWEARFPVADPTHQILSAREPCEWRRPMDRPHASWL